MADLHSIRAGLAALLATSGLNVGRDPEWPDQVNPPMALIKTVAEQFEQAFGSGAFGGGDARGLLQIEVHLALVLKGGLVNAQKAIELYLSSTGTQSLYQAIAADRSLGGTANYCFIRGWRAEDSVAIAGNEYMGAIVDLEVDC
jgi:hypothetical protein